MKYSEPRFTKDLDVLIANDQDNANAMYSALKEFGAPLENLTSDDFTHDLNWGSEQANHLIYL